MGTRSHPGCFTFHPAPCLWPAKAVEDGPHALEPCIHMGDPEEALGSWLQIGSALAVAAAWGVIQLMDDLPLGLFLSVPPPLCKSDFSIKNKS